MKKEANKPEKKEKKETRKKLFLQFTAEIAKLVDTSGYESKKVAKEIKKVANHLSKKLAAKTPQAEKAETTIAKAPAKTKPVKDKTEPVAQD